MNIYVINLERRPDRRRAMEEQADRLGLRFQFVRAVDVLERDEATLRRSVRRGPMGDLSIGDICCHLSHREVWRRIAAGDEGYAVVLEDDARLSDDAAAFLARPDWIPRDAALVKLEAFGNRRHRIVVSRRSIALRGRRLHTLHSKHVGGAGYILGWDTAQMLLAADPVPSLSVDQLLFNPNVSPLFRRLRPLQLLPAIVVQDGPCATSDIHAFRVSQRTYDGAYWRRELRRGWHEISLLPLHAALLATGRAAVAKPRFAAVPETRARGESAALNPAAVAGE